MAQEKAQWGSPLEFILSVIGCAVGLGNVWRFPYLVFKHGGGPFLIPFFILLFIIGIPTFFLETAVGQFSGLSPAVAYAKMSPIFLGLGYACIFINSMIGFYYNVIIAYLLHYFIMSFRSKLRWSDCEEFEASYGGSYCYTRLNMSTTKEQCQADKLQFAFEKNTTLDSLKSPSEIYFYGAPLLGLSDSITDLGGIQPELAGCLIGCWLIVFLVLCKGVQILGKVSYFTATFPYVMMTILVIAGAILEGSGLGVQFYLLGNLEGKFDFSKIGIELLKDAAGQIFFALSSCTGALIAMSSFSNFDNNLIRDTFLVPILDIGTGFYAGFAIFTVLGNMYVSKCADSFEEIAAQGPELSFIVYPEGLSLMGSVGPAFSVLFFFMMLALGFGSEFGIIEATMTTIIDNFRERINTKPKEYAVRGIIALTYLLLGLILVTKGGFFVLSLIDNKIGGNPLLMIGLCQVICVPWFYGTRNFIRDIESMVGKKPKWFWIIFQICWKVITPIVLIALLLLAYLPPELTKLGSGSLTVNGKELPDYAEVIGYIIEFIPISIVIGCAIYQIIVYGKDGRLRELNTPHEDYYLKQKNFYQRKEEKELEKNGDLTMVTTNEKKRHSLSSNKVAPIVNDLSETTDL